MYILPLFTAAGLVDSRPAPQVALPVTRPESDVGAEPHRREDVKGRWPIRAWTTGTAVGCPMASAVQLGGSAGLV
jgi:hypothetical protein